MFDLRQGNVVTWLLGSYGGIMVNASELDTGVGSCKPRKKASVRMWAGAGGLYSHNRHSMHCLGFRAIADFEVLSASTEAGCSRD